MPPNALERQSETPWPRSSFLEHDQDGLWEVRVEQDGYLNRKLASKLRKLAKEHGGLYDGDIDIST